jgi:hypothetical protein
VRRRRLQGLVLVFTVLRSLHDGGCVLTERRRHTCADTESDVDATRQGNNYALACGSAASHLTLATREVDADGFSLSRCIPGPPNVLGVSCAAGPACRSRRGAAVAANEVLRTEWRSGRVGRGDYSPRPPCRSGHAGLPHPAPRITDSLRGVCVNDFRRRQHVTLQQLFETFPHHVVAL